MDDLTNEEREFLKKELHMYEFELVYFSGEWHHYEWILDVCDEAGIATADELFPNSCLEQWPYGIALWRTYPTKELLKTYVEAKPLPPTEKQTRPLPMQGFFATIRVGYVSERGKDHFTASDIVERYCRGLSEDDVIIKDVLIRDFVPDICID